MYSIYVCEKNGFAREIYDNAKIEHVRSSLLEMFNHQVNEGNEPVQNFKDRFSMYVDGVKLTTFIVKYTLGTAWRKDSIAQESFNNFIENGGTQL